MCVCACVHVCVRVCARCVPSVHAHSMCMCMCTCMCGPWVGDCKLRILALDLSQTSSTHDGASGCHRIPRGRSESALEPVLMAATDQSLSKGRGRGTPFGGGGQEALASVPKSFSSSPSDYGSSGSSGTGGTGGRGRGSGRGSGRGGGRDVGDRTTSSRASGGSSSGSGRGGGRGRMSPRSIETGSGVGRRTAPAVQFELMDSHSSSATTNSNPRGSKGRDRDRGRDTFQEYSPGDKWDPNVKTMTF